MTMLALQSLVRDGDAIADAAVACLKLEIRTYPKPGLVSPIDTGSHDDMDVAMMDRSAQTLAPYFGQLAQAGAAGAGMNRLRAIGLEAEAAMMVATGGVNTHRGAIFGMGLLCAAAGFRRTYGAAGTLGTIVANRWGADILRGPVSLRSHGSTAARRYGAGGARIEAATGFPSVYAIAVPALVEGSRLAPDDPEARRIHALMTLIARVEDTNLLHRGGIAGLTFAQRQAALFLIDGTVATTDWRTRAEIIHRSFVMRRLSPGGCADLLAMALFVETQGT